MTDGRGALRAEMAGGEFWSPLTEDQRETLRLHFFEGYTFEESPEKLGQSLTEMLEYHHYRGLEKVRKHLSRS